MNLIYLLLPIAVSLAVIGISTFEVEAANEKIMIDYSQKIVWQFESDNDLEDKKNKFENDMKTEIKKSTDELKKDFNNFDVKMKSKDSAIYIIGINPNNGNTIYETYPKIIITGDSKESMSDAEFNILFDSMLSQLRIDMVQYFFDEGYTNVKTHIHYNDPNLGEDFDEGF